MTSIDVYTEAGDQVRERVRSAITHLVLDTLGQEALREVPIWPGAQSTERRPEPLHGLRAALRLRAEATGMARRYVEELRGEGASWAAVAVEVRRTEDIDSDDVAAVFEEFAVHGGTFDAPWMSWRCGRCGERIIDYGPYNPHPADVERGHADDCVRHAAHIRAYEQDRG